MQQTERQRERREGPQTGPVAELERLTALLPAGAIDVARQWRPWPAGDRVLATELLLPLVAESDWPGPADPLRVGNGWVQADITEDDIDTLDRLRQSLTTSAKGEGRPAVGAEDLATAAQEWRLPVLPYRTEPWCEPAEIPTIEPVGPTDLSDKTVVDMSSLWAGPLATRLLSEAGADVVKVDPDCRPDGFRQRHHLYNHLNDGKQIVDLDLRQPADREAFEDLVRSADLLVSSFSRRVLPNLGYDPASLRRLNSNLATVAVAAFPVGCPEQDWLAYGSGIHAIVGLGLADGSATAGDSRSATKARPAPVAYPDPLTGYAAANAGVRLMETGSGGAAEVCLVHAGAAVAAASRPDEQGQPTEAQP